MPELYCPACNKSKPAKQFHRNNRRKSGYQGFCKDCNQKKRPKDKARDQNYRHKYGITLEQWNQLYTDQDGRCAICKTNEPGGMGNRLHVDHCHETGRVRGLLCTKCNVLCGYANDDVSTLLAAVAYLTKQQHNKFGE